MSQVHVLACLSPMKPPMRVQPCTIRVNASAAHPPRGGCTYIQLVLGPPVRLAAAFQAEVCAYLLRGGTATYAPAGLNLSASPAANLGMIAIWVVISCRRRCKP